jgi:MarR family transcriptional regulator for hemolysin
VAKSLNGEKDIRRNKYVSFIDNHYNLAAQVFFTHHALSKAKQSQLIDIGITYVEFQLLWAVEGLGKAATPAEISRVLMRKPPTMSALLNRMEKNGLVKRKNNPKNKKLKMVVMTPKGKKSLKLARQDDIIHNIMNSMTKKELDQLSSLLGKLKSTAYSCTKEITGID